MSDAPKKSSAKDYFTGNKIGVVVVGVTFVVVGGLALIAHEKRTATPPSSLAAPPQINSVAGEQATPQYNGEIKQMNMTQAGIAQANGKSFIPTPVGQASGAFSGTAIKPMLGVPQPAPQVNANSGQIQLAQPTIQAQPTQLSMANPPQAYLDEVKGVLGAIAPAVPQAVAVSAAPADATVHSVASTGPAQTPPSSSQAVKFPANIDPVQYAVAEIAANSDVPGPVLLRIPAGPLRGATMIGSFQRESGYLSIRLKTMEWHGLSWSTNAVAIDPNTSLPAVRSAVDNHTISRYAALLGGAFLGALQGYGQAIAQSGQTTVQTVGNAATLTANPTMTPHQALIIAGATAAGTAAQTVGQSVSQGWNQSPTVTLSAGTGVGVLFIGTPTTFSEQSAEQPVVATQRPMATSVLAQTDAPPLAPSPGTPAQPMIHIGSQLYSGVMPQTTH
jgi:hypothetical protein